MITILTTYNIDWRLKFATNFAVTKDGIVTGLKQYINIIK